MKIKFFLFALPSNLLISLLLLSLSPTQVQAQFSFKDKKGDLILGIMPEYTYQFGTGYIQENYSNFSNIGFGGFIKFKNNYLLGIRGNFIFGANVTNRNILGQMVTNNQTIISRDLFGEIPSLEGRGANVDIRVGKIFQVFRNQRNSGVTMEFNLGYGFYQTFVNVDNLILKQFSAPYDQAYDRRIAGFSFGQFIGYSYFSYDRVINATIGFQNYIHFMNLDYAWDFETNLPANRQPGTFMTFGPKFGLIIGIFPKNQKEVEGEFYTK
ncbi:MAG: hypothetical protein MUE53_09965 [Chitinophagales bacterium]|jgi:hypothetical protein|nr:hypothetical protein [Chitinophagales bacterium]